GFASKLALFTSRGCPRAIASGAPLIFQWRGGSRRISLSCQGSSRSFARGYSYHFNALWPNSATSHTITTVMGTAKRYSPAVKMFLSPGIGRTLQGPSRPRPRIFTWLCCSQQSGKQKHARYESIHKAVQYKNSGAIQIGIMNGSDVITMNLKEDSQCSRR